METPDRWVILNVTSTEENQTVQKVMCGSYGGYTGSDVWRISSQIKQVAYKAGMYTFTTYSGNEYQCAMHSYGMSGLMADVYEGYAKQNTDKLFVEIDDGYKELHRKFMEERRNSTNE